MTAIAELLGDNFLRAVACVLIRKGESVRDRKIEETVADLEVESLVTIETIISDFFSLNDLPSHFGRITGIMKNVTMGADAEEKEGQEAQESTGPESSTQSATEILDE